MLIRKPIIIGFLSVCLTSPGIFAQQGEIRNRIEGFERPMHIDVKDGELYIPEYGSDQIVKYRACVMPFGRGEKITHALMGLSWKTFE